MAASTRFDISVTGSRVGITGGMGPNHLLVTNCCDTMQLAIYSRYVATPTCFAADQVSGTLKGAQGFQQEIHPPPPIGFSTTSAGVKMSNSLSIFSSLAEGTMRRLLIVLTLATACLGPAHAWGPEGH